MAREGATRKKKSTKRPRTEGGGAKDGAAGAAGGGAAVREGPRRGGGGKRARREAGPEVVPQKDHDAVLAALEKVAWTEVVNTSRKNVIPGDAPKCAKGKPYCMSFILGPNMKDPERRPSYWTEQNPELFRLLCELMKKRDPDHQFTNITINKNLRCKPHRDRGNHGMSYIIGFGDYQGGELMVGPRSAKAPGNDPVAEAQAGRGFVKHIIRRRWLSFFGAQETHFTAPFTGDRYTCVFYNFPDVHVNTKRLTANAKASTADTSFGSKAPQTAIDPAFRSKLEAYKAKLKRAPRARK
ncbi:Hypothetical Protein FCC1311_083812 [Hondaea fermentalgiana]|uniref:Uncharacterized protein n=1 Tax=Hondaea fermentalgiana TaxID=2315210 RepID=A0A2R5GMP5_9STRA|nr:Hypothetical Protein FCC1311_083812 [Hondaea fermentalgiana]|eukprot:GBG32156.1 Hypothetical Protein FCC1311_083812 [Hondaea fermentalgiana]